MSKVLLADDSTHAQRMATKILAGEGIEVVTVSNGEAAVKKLADSDFDVVLADVFMPGRTGYEVCSFIKTNPKLGHIPVVLVVGQLEPFNPEQSRKVQADAVLKKPFEASEVVSTMREMLQLAEQRRPAPPPPPPPKEVETVQETELAEELATTASSAVRLDVPADLQEQAAFGLFEETPPAKVPTAAPASAAVEAPAPQPPPAVPMPAVSTMEVVVQAAQDYGPEPQIIQAEESLAAPVSESTAEPVIEYAAPAESAPPLEEVQIPELAVADLEEEAAPAAMAAVAPGPVWRWIAEAERVTDADRAVFAIVTASAAVATTPAPAPAAAPEPAAGLDWSDLLRSVEEPAAVPAEEATAPPAPAPEIVIPSVPEPTRPPVPSLEAEPALTPPAAPIPAMPVMEAAPPAPEPVGAPAVAATPSPTPEPVAAVAAAAETPSIVLDESAVRAAVEAAFEEVLPSLKPVPGLLDTLTAQIMRRLGMAS